MNKKPNIILIMTDQQQARVCGREGFPLEVTPHQDRMAAQGVWFDKAYTATPLCGPARVSTFTGRFPTATGIRSNRVKGEGVEIRGKTDLLQVLRGEGYHTALIGKNHTHFAEKDFDFWYHHSHSGAYSNEGLSAEDRTAEVKAFDDWLRTLDVEDTPTPFPLECQGPYRLVSTTEKWIREVKEQENPFFIWLSISEPHNPYQVPEPYFSMFRDQELPPIRGTRDSYKDMGFKYDFTGKHQRFAFSDYEQKQDHYRYNYYGMCRLIDDQLQRLDGMLEAEGVLENTLVVFVSDHGDFVGDYGLRRKGPGLSESLCRIPMIFRGPGVVPGQGPHPAHVQLVDLFPTICEWIGVPIPHGVQGRSLAPILKGEPFPEAEFDTAYCETGYGGRNYGWGDDPDMEKYTHPGYNELNEYALGGSMRMVRHRDWKLILDAEGLLQMYDLQADPEELCNRAEDPAAADMRALLLQKLALKLIQLEDPICNVTPDSKPDRQKTHPRNYHLAGTAEG